MRAARIGVVLAAGLFCIAAMGSGWRWPEGRGAPRIPAGNAMNAAKVELGRRLFYDADLSADGSMACSSCHVQRHGFADSVAVHPGVHGDPGRRNAPGLANVAWLRPLTWGDPRITTLEAQAAVPILGTTPVEMGMHEQEAEIARRLGRDSCYVRMFRDAFPETNGRIDMGAVQKALASFERTLVSNQSPWDRWRAGDRTALTPPQREGARAFARSCATCHSGPDLGDGRFHAIEPAGADRGLAEISGKPGDNGRFRTPPLRNVALTAPYLHDGSAVTLADAIARHREATDRLSDADRQAILVFLGTLTDRAFVTDHRYSLPDSACGLPL